MIKYFTYIIMLSFLLVSCKKNKDTSAPDIEIFSPINNHQFSALDTIHISGIITDETNISSISISLVDENRKIIGKAVHLEHSDNNYSIDHDYILNDIHLESGSYTLEIGATDGTNSEKVFIHILIQSVPIGLEQIFVLCQNDFDNTELYSLDLNYNKSFITQYDFQLQDAEINSYYQQISMLTNQGILNSYNIEDMSLEWTASDLHLLQNPFYGKLEYLDEYLYSSTSSGHIYAYDNNGVIRKSAAIESDKHVPGLFVKHSDYLFTGCVSILPVVPKIEKLFSETGYPMDHYEVNIDFVALYFYNDDKIIIWGNHNNITKVCTLSVEYNVLYEIDDFNQEKLNAVEQIDANNYIVSSGNSVYSYNSLNTVMNEVISNCAADRIIYNAFLEKVFIVKDLSLFIYNYPDFTLNQEVVFQYDIEDICFHYNK